MPRSPRAKTEADNARNKQESLASRDIAPGFPDVGDLRRRTDCGDDFRLFCERYFSSIFYFPWSDDHLRAIERIQSAVLEGGLFALAMPRGSGKTELCKAAALWALLYGHRRFVCLVGATEAAAERLLDHLKIALTTNEELVRDHRQVCYPFVCLENNARRCIGQLFEGRQTRTTWSAKEVTFATMPDYACDGINVSGSTITVAGLTGALRGQSHALANGSVIRPELVILDDPQTRESANSPSQCADRTAIVTGDVLGMAGPGRKIAAIMPCTVIREGDLAAQLTDREKNPQWQGERTKAIYSWPKRESLWDSYCKIRSDGLRRGKGVKDSFAYYESNREAMDAGAVVAWPAMHSESDLSALQYLMDKRFEMGIEAFSAEYQNEPLSDESDAMPTLVASEVASKTNGIKRGVVPANAAYLTAFIDVHDALLFWSVVAWSADFTGWIVDYGAYPDQRRRSFLLRKANPTLTMVSGGAGREGSIYAGLTSLSQKLFGCEWKREDGGSMRIERCLVDAGYAYATVCDFCKRSEYTAILMPSRGEGVGAAKRPMIEYQRKPGERFGWNWLITRTANRSVTYVRFDSNHWKSFVHSRLGMAVGDIGSLTLYGRNPEHHRQLADHITAEMPTRVTANGRTVDEWRIRPAVSDNHWLDCLVGSAVAASMSGASVDGATHPEKVRKRYTQSDLRRRRA